MLVNFRVENFKSFKNLTEFSMETTKLKNLIDSNTFDINNISLLKSAVIYGANASGKSSLIDAFRSLKSILKNSIDIEKTKRYQAQPFLLNTETEGKETFLEIEFIIEEIIYRYGFKIAKNAVILQEWLYQKKLKIKAREVRLFFREEQDITLGTLFKEGKLLAEKTRDNTLFLSVVAQFDGEISKNILTWINQLNTISNLKSDEFEGFSFSKFEDKEDEEFKEKIINFIKQADVGIYNIENKNIKFDDLKQELNLDKEHLKKIPEELILKLEEEGVSKIETVHMQYDKDNSFKTMKSFDLEFESDGTQKLLALSGPIIETLSKGEILVVDELDNSLHTELVEAIVQLFNSKETNPNNAQLIFTTHDTNLLNQKLFRRDQIWFTQKDIYGVSELYSLVEYGTRNDLALEKNYLDGKFGAVPHISSLNYGEN